MKFLRWSLSTQVIVTLVIGLAFLIWSRRSPWVKADASLRQELMEKYNGTYAGPNTPDGTRFFMLDGPENTFFIMDRHGKNFHYKYSLWSENFYRLQFPMLFFHNDAFAVKYYPKRPDGSYDPLRTDVYWRRFPEWWWGHLYRPEVWLLPLMLGLLVWSIRKDRAVRA